MFKPGAPGGVPGRKCPSKIVFPERPCVICGKKFIPQREWNKFCSSVCRERKPGRILGNSKKRTSETESEFLDRIRRYRINAQKKYVARHVANGACRACPLPVMPTNGCWCEKHWFMQAAYRNGFRKRDDWKSVKDVLERQGRKCPYTGKKLVPGVNASIDHKNSRQKFPEQFSDINNIEWIDRDVNAAKGYRTKAEFISLCRIVSSRHPARRKKELAGSPS